LIDLIDFLCFNATFSNISWRPVLVVEKKPEYPERTTDHGQATGKLYHLRLRVECMLFCNLQS
jgi:predicted secreted protein